MFTMQLPNPNLTATFVDDLMGLQTITFDWGPSGHAESSADPFNFFATKFETTTDVRAEYLGDAALPLPGANFFVSVPGAGIQCLPPPDDQRIQACGESTTSYYRVTAVPEPSSVMLFVVGIGAMLGFLRVKRGRSL